LLVVLEENGVDYKSELLDFLLQLLYTSELRNDFASSFFDLFAQLFLILCGQVYDLGIAIVSALVYPQQLVDCLPFMF
jgi:hypothetical protein